MIPKKQKVSYFTGQLPSEGNIDSFCEKLIKKGWVIQQIIPYRNNGAYYILLNKY